MNHVALLFTLTAIMEAVGSEPWPRHTIDDTSRGADGVRLRDVNADGHMDIATGWEEGRLVRVYLNPGPQEARRPWPMVHRGTGTFARGCRSSWIWTVTGRWMW